MEIGKLWVNLQMEPFQSQKQTQILQLVTGNNNLVTLTRPKMKSNLNGLISLVKLIKHARKIL